MTNPNLTKFRIRGAMLLIAAIALGLTAFLQGPHWWKSYQEWRKRQVVMTALNQPTNSNPHDWTTLGDGLVAIKKETVSADFPDGILLYVDPIGLQTRDLTLKSPARITAKVDSRMQALHLLLDPLGLEYRVGDAGLSTITSKAPQ